MDKDFKQCVIDRLEGWELVEFLQIKTEDIVEAFEEQIIEAQEDVEDFIGLKGPEDDTTDED